MEPKTKAAANSRDLVSLAYQHTLFSLVPQSEVQSDGPCIYIEGKGPHVTDQDGRQLLDMMSSVSRANSLGYGSEEVARAMYEQALRMHYSGTTRFLSEPAVTLAAKLAELAPGRLSKVCFVSGGSEATETALKLARQYQQNTGKPRAFKVISRWNAYHGSTLGALSVTDWLSVRDIPDPRAVGHSFVANPMRYRNPYGMSEEDYADHCASHLERQIQFEGPDLVAAFIAEPIMQANGVQIPTKAYLQKVREICTRYGVLLIIDEVITGFGRTGRWFASEHFGIEPDIMTMAKAMSAGYAPLGAVMTRDEIADALPVFRHVHTFSGHAVACAAANAVIAIKEREGLIPRAAALGAEFGANLAEAVAHLPIVGDVRGLGLWHAVDFTRDKKTKEVFTDDTVKAVVRRMRDLGVVVSAIGSALEIAPPLIVGKEHLDRTVAVCAQAITEVTKERGLA
jgi:putrescine aminotransferase